MGGLPQVRSLEVNFAIIPSITWLTGDQTLYYYAKLAHLESGSKDRKRNSIDILSSLPVLKASTAASRINDRDAPLRGSTYK
jgi:hypothetical protein